MMDAEPKVWVEGHQKAFEAEVLLSHLQKGNISQDTNFKKEINDANMLGMFELTRRQWSMSDKVSGRLITSVK
jgi:hypothetical protein